ncbi:hypothetical protein JX265_008177 [Neoarthrinium moseri]|uniref:Uncharacterized protein n=1 Tax=Neoarthrinium moseri TaxID=1658444 RepID=A0A9Q0AMR9_9PEZI|nr:uncharacterized protein JN550_004875 [Neoarthrinium moseri]KAI1852017.1 hypothetical protein JX266_002870 [Neoarthrinium moseri]KAI1865130.1 hypothetical protein JX265_008177 [Neoarthrinium moseri]KAI1870729.1 hypothetical protein JN550_004875 [Neoarthrinium moseri]
MLPHLLIMLIALLGQAMAWSNLPFTKRQVTGTGPVLTDIIDKETRQEHMMRADCAWAQVHTPMSHAECISEYHTDGDKVSALSGTGQNPSQWADEIILKIKTQCDGKVAGACVQETSRNLTDLGRRTYAVDQFTGKAQANEGVVLEFDKTAGPWWFSPCEKRPDDAWHRCVTEGIRLATCYQVSFANGLACRKKGYYGDNSLPANSQSYGHPVLEAYDDNLAGPGI